MADAAGEPDVADAGADALVPTPHQVAQQAVRRQIIDEHLLQMEPTYVASRLRDHGRYQAERNPNLSNDLEAGSEVIGYLLDIAATAIVARDEALALAARETSRLAIAEEIAPGAVRAAVAEVALEATRTAAFATAPRPKTGLDVVREVLATHDREARGEHRA